MLPLLRFQLPFRFRRRRKGPEGDLGTVEGIITFRGDVSKSGIPDDSGVHRELLQVDRGARGLRYLVIGPRCS
jgi:hypothetical protein